MSAEFLALLIPLEARRCLHSLKLHIAAQAGELGGASRWGGAGVGESVRASRCSGFRGPRKRAMSW